VKTDANLLLISAWCSLNLSKKYAYIGHLVRGKRDGDNAIGRETRNNGTENRNTTRLL
jgi:hypothetical protein